MERQKFDRDVVLRKMGDHVLVHGLNTASLRPLAKAAGTSDRMLIYHFESKDALIQQVLQSLATRLSIKLEAALPAAQDMSVKACLDDIISLLRRPPFSAYMRVWLDIVSSAVQGNDKHAFIGGVMLQGFFDWLKERIPLDEPDPDTTVRAMMVLIEGTLVLDAVGQSEAADRARLHLFPEEHEL